MGCESHASILHLFGAYATDPAALPVFASLTERVQINTSIGRLDGDPRLFRVSSQARERQRQGAGLAPLERREVEADTGSWRHGSGLKLAIRAIGMELGDQAIVIDVGQPVQLYACSIELEWRAPAGTQDVASPRTASPTASGLVFDALVAAKVLTIEETTPGPLPVLSEVVNTPAGSSQSVPIPRGARTLDIAADFTLAAAPEWRLGSGALANPITLAEIGITGPESRKSPLPVPNSATHLFLPAPQGDQRYLLTWGIRP